MVTVSLKGYAFCLETFFESWIRATLWLGAIGANVERHWLVGDVYIKANVMAKPVYNAIYLLGEHSQ